MLGRADGLARGHHAVGVAVRAAQVLVEQADVEPLVGEDHDHAPVPGHQAGQSLTDHGGADAIHVAVTGPRTRPQRRAGALRPFRRHRCRSEGSFARWVQPVAKDRSHAQNHGDSPMTHHVECVALLEKRL